MHIRWANWSRTAVIAVLALVWRNINSWQQQHHCRSRIYLLHCYLYSIIAPAKDLSKASYSIRKGWPCSSVWIKFPKSAYKSRQCLRLYMVSNREIEFRNVSFRYQSDWLQKHRSCDSKRKTVALVGQSGSGKFTLVTLYRGIMDAEEGQILIDGVDVRELRTMISERRWAMWIRKPFCSTILFSIISLWSGKCHNGSGEAARIANARVYNGYRARLRNKHRRPRQQTIGGQRFSASVSPGLFWKIPPILILTKPLRPRYRIGAGAGSVGTDPEPTTPVVAHRSSTIKRRMKFACRKDELFAENTMNWLLKRHLLTTGGYAIVLALATTDIGNNWIIGIKTYDAEKQLMLTWRSNKWHRRSIQKEATNVKQSKHIRCDVVKTTDFS